MKSWVVSALILLSMTPLCFGELQGGSQTLTLMGGGAFSASEFDQQGNPDPSLREHAADPGGAIGGQYLYFIRSAPALGFGVDILNSALQEHESDNLLTDFHTGTRFQPTTVLGIAKLAFGRGPIHPYVFGGIGFHRTSFIWDLQPKGDEVWANTGTQESRRVVDDTETGFASAAGVGVDIFLNSALFIGAEARGTYLGAASYQLTSQGVASGFSGEPRPDFVTFNLLAHIGIKFGA